MDKRKQLTTVVRLLTVIGILLLMLVFLRACLSPPPLPTPKTSASPDAPVSGSGLLPDRY
ncbi:MAG: hypothetical protein ACOY9J_06100 [Pseudomonadota bacterium]